MTNKELIEQLKQYPEDATISVFDGCCYDCLGSDVVDGAGYDDIENIITIG